MQTYKKILIEEYEQARKFFQNFFGETPENYKVLVVTDEELYDKLAFMNNRTRTPHGIATSELTRTLKLDDDGKLPTHLELTVPSQPSSKLYLPSAISEHTGKHERLALRLRLIHQLAQVFLVERSTSRYATLLHELYQTDLILKELFFNNVLAIVHERGASWAWQYYQDFTGILRVLSLYNMGDLYTPPDTMRENSVFYNYLIESIDLMKKRARIIRKLPLFDLILQGFAWEVHNEALQSFDVTDEQLFYNLVKNVHANPWGYVGARLLSARFETNDPREYLTQLTSLYSDMDLIEPFERKEMKTLLEAIREQASEQWFTYHPAIDLYWSDLWPLHAIEYDKIEKYIGTLQRRKIKNIGQLLDVNPMIKTHGYVRLKDRNVHVFTMNSDEIGLTQLLVLRNHLREKKHDFLTPLPGLPDIIVFRVLRSMHVATYLSVGKPTRKPRSPYDLPRVQRAVLVTRQKDAYKSVLEDQEDPLGEEADYSELKGVSEPQRNAIRYLIKHVKR